VLRCLEWLRLAGYRSRVVVCADDGLLVRQFVGLAPVPAEVLPLRERIGRLAGAFRAVEFRQVAAEESAVARELARCAGSGWVLPG